MTREAVSIVLVVVGLLGIAVNLTLMISKTTYETVRPWAGLQKRARTRKDGSTYIQTYYSKGPAVTKAKMKGHWSYWLFFAAFWVGLFIG